jgi:hypothetical protein
VEKKSVKSVQSVDKESVEKKSVKSVQSVDKLISEICAIRGKKKAIRGQEKAKTLL